MALFSEIFAKQKQQAQAQEVQEPYADPLGGPVMQQPSPDDLPVDHILTLRNQGLNNNQIIQTLQRYGYSVDQINNAFNQADVKTGVQTPFGTGPGATLPRGGSYYDPSAMQNMPAHGGPPMGQGMGGMGPMSGPAPSQAPRQARPADHEEETGVPSASEEKIHEIAEAIIEEKWQDITQHVEKIISWKEETEQKLAKMEQDLAHLSTSFDKLHEGVLGKIGDYDKTLENVGTEIKALEKVFQKILPGFVENVQELSRITRKMKEPQMQSKV